MGLALAIYAIGAAAGLVLTDASRLARVAIALLWPLGAMAFVVTIATLIVAALMLIFPVSALVLASAAATWIWASG